MDLAELKFVVITDDLVTAAERVKALGTEVSKLNKPMQDLTSNSNKVSSATEKAAKATETKAKADTKIVDTSSKLESLLDKLTNRYTDMAKGSTSAEAGVLQLARSLGATTEDALKPYKAILENIRELSKSPFDSAIGSVRSITQEYDSLTYRAELASKGIFLTTAQLKEYSRIANEIKGKLKAADLDPTKGEGLAKFNSELKVQQDLYLGIATKVNTLKTAEKDRNDLLNTQMKESVRLQEASDNLFKYNLIRHKQDQDGYKQDMLEMRKYYSALEKESKPTAQTTPARMDAAVDAYRQNQAKVTNDAAKANAYLAKEMERVNRLNAESESVTSSTNNRLIRFEQELRKSGATAEEQSHKLAAYRKELMATQKAAGNRQVDYLSRALGPQITDIGVGLATGQSPMMVLLQQGGQLRDQFALAGVAGKDMGDMLTKATLGMVSSVKDVGVAVGGALVNAFAASGKAANKFLMDITGTASALENMRYQIALMEGSNGKLMAAFKLAAGAITALTAAILIGAITALIAYGVALNDLIKEENALNRALNLTGAAMGMNSDMAYVAANNMKSLGITVGDSVAVITSMAKAGGMSSDSLELIAITATRMKTAFGISIDDTVKKFKDLQEKPTGSLTKLAVQLGTIPVAVLKQVDAYERAGKSIEAAKLATETYAKAGKDAADKTIENFGHITALGINLKKIWDGTWDSIMGWGRKDTLADQLKSAEDNLKAIQSMRGADVANSRTNQRMLASMKLVDDIKNQIAAEKDLETQKAQASAAASKFEDDKKKRDESAAKSKSELNAIDAFSKNIVEQATKAYVDQYGAVEDLTKSQTSLNKLHADPLWSKVPESIRQQVTALYEAAGANEKLVDAEQARSKQMAVIASLTGKADGFGKEYYSTLKTLDEAYVDGNLSLEKYIESLNKLYSTTPQAKAFANVQTEHAKTMADLGSERTTVAVQYEGDFKTADQKAAIKNVSDYRKSISSADAEYEKKIADASKNLSGKNLEEAKNMYKAQADEKKALAEDVHNREIYLLSDAYKRQAAIGTAFEDLFKGMGDAIIDFALTGKTSFGDLVQSILIGLAKMEMQMAMSSAFKSMGGLSGIASLFTGTPVASAKGNMFDSSGIQAFANGGTFTNSIVSEPTLFKFAKGTGLMGEAGPEAIMPLRRGSDGSLGVVASGGSSSGSVSVQVINNTSSQATTNETVDSRGNRKIEVVIGDMQAGEIARNGSASQKSIKSTFGIKPQLIRR